MWATRLISDAGLTATPGGFDLDIRLPWYRSLPLSTFRGLTLRVDGVEVPNPDIELEVNGTRRALDQMGDLVNEMWHMQDSGLLHVRRPDFQKNGDPHEVELNFRVQIPYSENFILSTRCLKTLQAA
jgi:hypothetical protein